MAHGNQETEVKLAVASVRTARGLLRAAGFRIFKRRVFEINIIFDTPVLNLRKAGFLLRVREAGRVRTLTFKGRSTLSKHKSREELELTIPDAQTMRAILERLGFHQVFRYEKYRTEYKQPTGRGVATLDETPIGAYLELEGTAPWIDRMARRLHFSEQDYSTASYGALYQEWCRRHGVEPSDMVFSAPQ